MKVFIITGHREGGKSHFMIQLSETLFTRGKSVAGFVSKGFYMKDGCKDFELMDVRTRKTMHLASRKKKPGYEKFGGFYFNPAAIETGKHLIGQALNNKTDIFIIDEIGPFELNGDIWHDDLEKLMAKENKILLISVRKRLIHRVTEKFGIYDYTVKDIEDSPLENTVEEIMELISE